MPDIGFRVLKLDDSGIAQPKPGQLILNRIKSDRTDEDIIFEMMLKWGIDLASPIEKIRLGGVLLFSCRRRAYLLLSGWSNDWGYPRNSRYAA